MRSFLLLALAQRASAYAFCCTVAWGDDDVNGCKSYPSDATGGRCNTDYSHTCNSNDDCPTTPSPPPTPPPAPTPAPPGAWYANLPNVRVYTPNDTNVQDDVNNIFSEMQDAQFSYQRYALLLTAGNYGALEIPVGYYTSVMGTGASPEDVTVSQFSSLDAGSGGATQVFWRSVEGLSATTSTVTFAASQACPLRRVVVKGDLWLSEEGPPHWSSGGFLADSRIEGVVHAGTQQQYFFRNSEFGGFDYDANGWNFVSVGVEGVPATSTTEKTYEITTIDEAPAVAGKPYLVESAGAWSIALPAKAVDARGPAATEALERSIDLSKVYVAKPGDSAADINKGIADKEALLLTPAVYGLVAPLVIDRDGFVVLGIGFPTLVAMEGNAALQVKGVGVRVAGVLLEAGTAVSAASTDALLHWVGDLGLASDIFTRVGAFSGSPAGSCAKTRADVHVQVDGRGLTVDNTWFWHADHDDCGGFNPSASDDCYSGNGLLVNGADTTIYGLASEHTFENQVEWKGERGRVYFYQTELPYADEAYGQNERSGYSVDYSVKEHAAYGIGIYIVGVFDHGTIDAAIRAPPTAQFTTMLAFNNGGSMTQFAHGVICTSPGVSNCFAGDQCGGDYCYLGGLPKQGDPGAQRGLVMAV